MIHLNKLSLAVLALSFVGASAQADLARLPNAVDSETTVKKSTFFPEANEIHLEPVAGISALQLPNEAFNGNGVDVDSKDSFNAGLVAGALVNLGDMDKNNRVLETGLIIYQAGAEVTATKNGVSTEADVEVIYMSIPIIAKARKTIFGKSVFIKAGFQNSFLLSNHVAGTGLNDKSIRARSFDALGSIGFGSEFKMGSNKKLSFDASYKRSIFDGRQNFSNTQSQGFFLTLGMPL